MAVYIRQVYKVLENDQWTFGNAVDITSSLPYEQNWTVIPGNQLFGNYYQIYASGDDLGKTLYHWMEGPNGREESETIISGSWQTYCDYSPYPAGSYSEELSLDPPSWSLALSLDSEMESQGFTLDSEPEEGDIPVEDAAIISWSGPQPTRPYAMRNGVLDTEFNPASALSGEAEISGEEGDSVAVGLVEIAKVPKPTHFQVRWEFRPGDVVKDNLAPVLSVLGSVEPFEVGSISEVGLPNVNLIEHNAELVAAVARIRYLNIQGNTQELAGFAGALSWRNPTNEDGLDWTGRALDGLEYASSHILSSGMGARYDDLQFIGGGYIYRCEITDITEDQPWDTVEPPDDGGWGGGASWPIGPDPEVEPPPEPEGGPGPVAPPQGGTRPEAGSECECAPFYLYIGDWVQNVSINIWNLCQYIFQIPQSIALWVGYLAEVLKSGLDWVGDSLDNMLTYFEYFLEEWRRTNDALEGIKEAIEDLEPVQVDVTVEDDHVLVHGLEAEEDLPEVYDRKGVK